MYRYLSASTICSKMWTVYQEQSSKKTVSFAMHVEKCLRTAYCRQHGMFSFECSLVQRNEKKDFLSSVATTKPSLSWIKFETKAYLSGNRVWKLGNIAWVLFWDITQIGWGLRSHDAFRPIAHEQKYLMDDK